MKKQFMAGVVLVLASLVVGCDDSDKQPVQAQTYTQEQQQATYDQGQQVQQQQPAVIMQQPPQTVVVQGSNGSHSGPSMGDVIMGSAIGTVLGNHLSGNTGNNNYNNGGYRDVHRTTIINNNTTSRSSVGYSQPVSRGTVVNQPVRSYNSYRPSGSSTVSRPTSSYSSSTSSRSSYSAPSRSYSSSKSYSSSRSSYSSSRRR